MVRDACSGGVSAVCCAKGVVHVYISQSGKSLCKRIFVGFFTRVKANILKQQNVPIVHSGDHAGRNFTR